MSAEPSRDSAHSATLTALVGPAGAGKSTAATRMAAADPELVVLSLDQLRAEASPYGDECDQNATPAAVKQLHSQLDQQLAAGRHVLVDATNSHAADRCALLRIASRHQAATIAVVALPPLGEVLARNATRSPVVGPCGSARRVPEETVTAMHHRITADLHNLAAEGWRRVIMLSRTDALLAGDPYD